jgi:hypothetical protein
MEIQLKRYCLTDKHFIASGTLSIINNGKDKGLRYVDPFIDDSFTALYHPLTALEALRINFEAKYNSVLNCNGCRIDTSYRPTGSFKIYIIEPGKQATNIVHMFHETDKIEELTTITEHKNAYKMWLNSL